MYDTTNGAELLRVLGAATDSVLIHASTVYNAVELANEQLDQGQTDMAVNTIRNARAAANTYRSIQTMLDQFAPRSTDPADRPDGGMG